MVEEKWRARLKNRVLHGVQQKPAGTRHNRFLRTRVVHSEFLSRKVRVRYEL